MKKYRAVFWRGNPQLPKWGYETTRTIEARNRAAAARAAEKHTPAYGTMQLLRIEEMED